MNGIETTGSDKIHSTLQKLIDEQTRIALFPVLAGTSVFVRACRSVSPGTTANEVGRSVKASGPVATGRAGLMKIPKRGQKGKRPHGMYLTLGTKFITPRHFIENALASSRAAAASAMVRSVDTTITRIVSSSQ